MDLIRTSARRSGTRYEKTGYGPNFFRFAARRGFFSRFLPLRIKCTAARGIPPSLPSGQPLPLDAGVKVGMHIDGSRVRSYLGFPYEECMRLATFRQVKDYQDRGPDWLGSDRWDIVRENPGGR